MLSISRPPIIFLAFANDREGKVGYLRNLPEEARQVHAVLDAAAQAGLCEVVMHQNVTVDTVLDVFQGARYRDRIAIFHYGGHAESYELLLETADGKSAAADAGGLAAFLSRQRGLQLVFLNGCSTQPQVQGLLDAGIAAVIATAQAIDDTVATDFAVRFYKGLAGGAALQTAFHEAEAACKTAGGGQPRSVYVKKVISTSAKRAVADRWPWVLTTRPGAELVLQWNLPDAVNDPLFGLPPLPPDDLPNNPFRNILWFRREDAPIFFGRGYDIRELFQRITATDAAPVVLYYGQSGVGKSSLLAAGLLPRLEQVQTVVYVRRDQSLGLVGTLAANLPAVDNPGIHKDSGIVAEADLLARWCALETATGKPLTLLLDQVEEVYTRPNTAMPGEMGDFLDALVAIFGDPATRPQGHVILGFRKEWLAEIEKLLAERQLPRAKVFLQRLEKRGIVEAVTGPARSARLQQHFGLTVEDELAGEIADDLLADPSSAVAPTLQILLSKMWDQAKKRDYDRPIFDRDLYHDLRRQGLLLGDFLDQQLADLHAVQPIAVDSGLVLDLLAFHTTPLGTAEQRTLAELHVTYGHQVDILDGLLAACRDLYLLVDSVENHPDSKPISRLAHDTLAQLVRHRFEESDAPGQRARRILESRAVDWDDGKEGTPLDEADLAVVELGKPGMRVWKLDEARLIQASHDAQAQSEADRLRLQQERADAERQVQEQSAARATADARADMEKKNAGKLRRRAVALGMALTLALILASVAGYLFNDARIARNNEVIARAKADANAQAADYARATAVAAQIEVEHQARRIRVNQLTAAAENIFEQKPQLASLLLVEGMRMQHDQGEVLDTDALASAHRTLSQVGGEQVQLASSAIQSIAISTDSRWTAASAQDGAVYLIDNQHIDAPAKRLAIEAGNLTQVAFSPDGRWLASVGGDELIRLWSTKDLESDPQILRATISDVTMVEFSPSGARLAIHGQGPLVNVWDMNSIESPPMILQNGVRTYRVLAFSPDERWLAAGAWDGDVVIWNLVDIQTEPQILGGSLNNNEEDNIIDLVFSPNGALLATSSENGTVRVWTDWDTVSSAPSVLKHPDAVHTVAFSPKGDWIATGSDDDNARLWKTVSLSAAPVLLSAHNGNVRHLAFSSSGDYLATGSDQTARLWKMAFRPDAGTASTLIPASVLLGHEDAITAMAFSPDETYFMAANQAGALRRWPLHNSSAEPLVLRGHDRTKSARSVVFLSGGDYLASAGEDKTLRLWNLAQPLSSNVATMTIGSEVFSLAMSPNGKEMAIGAADGIVRIWDIAESSTITALLPSIPGTIWSVAYSANNEWLAAGSEIGVTYLWRRDSLDTHPMRLRGHRRDVYSLAFSPDSTKLATGGWDGTVLIHDLSNLQAVAQPLIQEDRGLATVAFSPDGNWLASGNESGVVRLWSMADLSAKPIELVGHDERVRSIAFSPDGQWFASAGQDNALILRSMADLTATPIVLRQGDANINSIAFGIDGRQIATAHADGGIRLWTLSVDELIVMACSVAGRNLTRDEWQQYFEGEQYRRSCRE